MAEGGVEVLRYKGHVVLDTSEERIRNFRIPLTMSSRVEGLRIEAWMRARMGGIVEYATRDCGVRHKTRGDVDGMVLYITALPYIVH